MVEQTRQYVWGNDWHYWTTRCVHEGLMRLLLSHWLCSKNVNVFIIHPTQVYTSDVRLWRRPFIDWDTDKDLLTGYHSQLKQRNWVSSACSSGPMPFCFPSCFVWTYSTFAVLHESAVPPPSLLTCYIQLPSCHWLHQGHVLDDVSENLGVFTASKTTSHSMIMCTGLIRTVTKIATALTLMCYCLKMSLIKEECEATYRINMWNCEEKQVLIDRSKLRLVTSLFLKSWV